MKGLGSAVEIIKPGSAANTYQADRCGDIGCMVRLYHSLRTHRQKADGFLFAHRLTVSFNVYQSRYVNGKGDKARYVIAGKRTQKAIWRYLISRDGAKADEPLFTTDSGKKLDRKYLYQLVSRTGERAGIDDAHPHRLRHTFAVSFLRNGGNVKLLQELLGHETLDMVMNYVKLAEQDIDGAVKHSPVDNWHI